MGWPMPFDELVGCDGGAAHASVRLGVEESMKYGKRLKQGLSVWSM